MMSSSQNEAPKRIVDETKRLYSNLLSHQLSDKQLARPTFRLILVIVKQLITETRILRNVFNANDFNDEKRLADKRSRVEFIQKLIDFVANHKQPVVGCIAAKIVAGLEPVKTNELLQALARIAQIRLSGQDASINQRPRTFTKPTQQLTKPTTTTTTTSSSSRVGSSKSGSASSQRTRGGSGSSSSRKTSIQNQSASGSPIKERTTTTSSKEPQQQVPPSSLPTNHPVPLEPSKQHYNTLEQTPIKQADKFGNTQQQQSASLKRTSIPIVSSESDISSRNLQQLRTNLKSLRGTLNEIAQMEDSLRFRLTSVLKSNG